MSTRREIALAVLLALLLVMTVAFTLTWAMDSSYVHKPQEIHHAT